MPGAQGDTARSCLGTEGDATRAWSEAREHHREGRRDERARPAQRAARRARSQHYDYEATSVRRELAGGAGLCHSTTPRCTSAQRRQAQEECPLKAQKCESEWPGSFNMDHWKRAFREEIDLVCIKAKKKKKKRLLMLFLGGVKISDNVFLLLFLWALLALYSFVTLYILLHPYKRPNK